MFKRWHLLLLGLAIGAVVLAQGVVVGAGGVMPGTPLSPSDITASGYISAKDAGFNSVTFTGEVFGPARSKGLYFDGSDAGFNVLFANAFFNTAATITAQQATFGAGAVDVQFRLQNTGSSGGCATDTSALCLRDNVSIEGSVTNNKARAFDLLWHSGDAGFSNVAAKFLTVPPESFCNTTSTVGTAAANGCVSGIGRFGTGTYFMIFNTSMPSNALVTASLDADNTCKSVNVTVDGGNSAKLTPSAACTTANTLVRWRIEDSPSF